MSNRLGRIQDLINLGLPSYAAAFVRARGVTVPTDPFLTGTVRFARKSGEFLTIFSPDNLMRAASPIRQNDTTITVDKTLKWIVGGSLLRIERRELVEVQDVVDEDKLIRLTAAVQEDHAAGVSVVLHAVPIKANGPIAKGASAFSVKTRPEHDLYQGDVLLLDTVEHELDTIDFNSIDPITGEKVWQVTTKTALQRALVDLEVFYLRAHPAYASQNVNIPALTNLASSALGPVLLDWVSGTLIGEETVDEVVAVKMRAANFAVIGSETRIAKNHPVLRVPIEAEQMMLWTLVEGKLNWNGEKTIGELTADSSGAGRFWIAEKLVPEFPPGQVTQWLLQVKPNVPFGGGPAKLIVQLEPNAAQEFALTSNVQQTIAVSFPADAQPVERISLAVSGDPGTTVELGDWNLTGSRVTAISYTFVARKAEGRFRWASSGMWAKPIFLSLDPVRVRTNLGARLNGGRILIPA